MLDFAKPYAEVHGNGMIHYEQDGRRFNRAGQPLDAEAAPAVIDKAAAQSARMTEYWRRRREEKAAADAPLPAVDVGEQSDEDLRALVEIAGGTWTDRAAALELLGDTQ
jgi:hypothetical protein